MPLAELAREDSESSGDSTAASGGTGSDGSDGSRKQREIETACVAEIQRELEEARQLIKQSSNAAYERALKAWYQSDVKSLVHAVLFSWQGAAKEARKQRDVETASVLDAVHRDCQALALAPEALRADRSFVLAAANRNLDCLQYASAELRGDHGLLDELRHHYFRYGQPPSEQRSGKGKQPDKSWISQAAR
jgi:hypothetical protein